MKRILDNKGYFAPKCDVVAISIEMSFMSTDTAAGQPGLNNPDASYGGFDWEDAE